MLDLKDLSSFQKQTAQLAEKRQHKSTEQCKLGFECLFKAETSGFADKNLLVQACDAFAEAMAQERGAVEPYVGMGYLLFLLKDYPMAISYLTEAARLAPEHPDVTLLLKQIKQQKTLPRPVAAPPMREPNRVADLPLESQSTTEIDYDRLYDALETLIQDEAHKLASGQVRPPMPSLQPKEVEKLHTHKQLQQAILKKIQAQLQIVDQEIDTTELRQKLKPLENALKRYDAALAASQEMADIKQGIQGLIERLPTLQDDIETAQNQADLEIPERMVDVLMDMCDQLADKLDELEQKKYPIPPLVHMYEILVGEVERLNEIFEDVLEQVL